MSVTPEILERQWKKIKGSCGFLQIDIQHPLEWHIGCLNASDRMLSLVCKEEIGIVESSKAMDVSRRMREKDNRWTLTFLLLKEEQRGVFATFCCDIIDCSRTAANEAEALELVVRRYRQWSRLLESQPAGLMDEFSQKGLLGELLFLEERINAMSSAFDAIQGWIAPEKGAQDFVYGDGWFEIKSVSSTACSIRISSLSQLANFDNGHLIVKRIDKAAPGKIGAFSLNDAVRRISGFLSEKLDALSLFKKKLNDYGYMDLRDYSEPKFFCSSTQKYRVDHAFPRITFANVPRHIISASYELDLPSLGKWLCE